MNSIICPLCQYQLINTYQGVCKSCLLIYRAEYRGLIARNDANYKPEIDLSLLREYTNGNTSATT